MLHILFVPGTFGSTIQYVLRTGDRLFSELNRDLITKDGSMHLFHKIGHYRRKIELEELISGTVEQPLITSPIYPMIDYRAAEVINFFKNNLSSDNYIFIYINNIKYAEINMLAQYHKIAHGVINSTIDIFCNNNAVNINQWNINYTHWRDMQDWELREWLSIFYPIWVQEWIDAKQYADPSWLLVSSEEILNNTCVTFKNIINYANNKNISDSDDFIKYWRTQQQYLLDEYELINDIVNTSILNKSFRWNKLNIIAEAIIQQHLRAKGYEIKCYNLNEFPLNSIDLHNLLESI